MGDIESGTESKMGLEDAIAKGPSGNCPRICVCYYGGALVLRSSVNARAARFSQVECGSLRRFGLMCYRLARALRKVRIGLGPWHAHLPRVAGAVRIALERAEARRSIPRTSIRRAEESRTDSKHVEDLSQHLECKWIMRMAPRAEIPMLSEPRSYVLAELPDHMRFVVLVFSVLSAGHALK